MLKKSSLSFAHSGLQCCVCAHSGASCGSTSPAVLPIPRARPSVSKNKRQKISTSSTQWRSYAAVNDSSRSYDFRDNMNWPCRKSSPSTIPTPYEIFSLEKHAVYSKHKFYELVKIYHPDRHSHTTFPSSPSTTLSPLECLERYRLVVRAHEILSDPAKRRAYDSSGAGWATEITRNTPSRHSRGFSSAAEPGKNYGTGPNDDSSPFANATWEDWERWYERTGAPGHKPYHSRQSYEGTYINPNAFASFVILLAVLTGIAQATRAGQYSGSIEERAAAFTAETSAFLTERAVAFEERGRTKDGRVRHFLERRDPSRYGLKDEEEETYRKHFGGHLARDVVDPPPGMVRERGKEEKKTKAHVGKVMEQDSGG